MSLDNPVRTQTCGISVGKLAVYQDAVSSEQQEVAISSEKLGAVYSEFCNQISSTFFNQTHENLSYGHISLRNVTVVQGFTSYHLG